MVNINTDFVINDDLVFKTRQNKKQIVLLNTGYPIDDFITKLKLRFNKKYNKIPAYTISRSGILYQHYNPKNYSPLFDKDDINKAVIPIAIENVGWLEYHKKTDAYLDWRGIKCNGAVIETNWRGKKLWADYTDEQVIVLSELINYLCIEYSIEKNFIGNNVLTHKPMNFKGILNRSNFSKNHYDLTPAFDFEKLTKLINN